MKDCEERSTTEKGTDFEKEVLKLFDLMGYKVERNILINARQIDIYAEKDNPPADLFRIAIECKDQKTNVGTGDVDKFHTKIHPLLLSKQLDRGYIISSSDFTAPAKTSAKSNGIICQTYQELLRSLANFSHYIDEMVSNFEESKIYNQYITLDGNTIKDGVTQEIKSLESYIKMWVHNGKSNHISILGEYGSGKTTLCMRLAHDLAIAYRKDPVHNRIPILINLRDYSKAMNLKQLITDLLVNTHRIQGMTNSIFMRMNETEKFVLIFDGFDEMAQKVNMNITVKNFEELAKTAIPEGSKVILTCRTEYFRSYREEKEILSSTEDKYINLSSRPNFEIIHILPFSLTKVKEFLKKFDYNRVLHDTRLK